MHISRRSFLPSLRGTALALLPLLTVSSLATAQAQAIEGATKHPFLWRVESRNGKPLKAPVFLYGTMHLGDRRLVTLPDVVEKALDETDAVYCELDMKDVQKSAAGMVKRMSLPRGQSLKKKLPAPLYERLDKQLARFGLRAQQVNRMRIWAVSVTFAQLEASKLGFSETLDDKVFKEADEDGKEVGGLETIQEQMEAISSGSEKDQIAMLDNSITQMERLQKAKKTSLGQLLEAYLSGSELRVQDYLDEVMVDPVLSDRYMRPLLGARNRRMTDRIDAKLQKEPGKKFLFAIGALHFVGSESILEMLRAKGYEIARVQPPQANWKQIVALRTEVARLKLELAKLKQQTAKK